MIGKVPPDDMVDLIFSRTGGMDPSVLVGPRYGEDAAAIDVNGEILVISSDPISLAVDRIGTLGVPIVCNDVSASGGTPRWLTVVIVLPSIENTILDSITSQLGEAADALGVAIVGGHTEYSPSLSQPILSLTCLGVTDRFIPTSGARPGDAVILTKGAGIEGTAILATDFHDTLASSVPKEVLARAKNFFNEISIHPEATIISSSATAMHDPTEGGVIDGLVELAHASEVCLRVDQEAIPIRIETQYLARELDIDPLRIFGSGALLATIPTDDVDNILSELKTQQITAAVIGTVEAYGEPCLKLDDQTFNEPVRDDLYPLWEHD